MPHYCEYILQHTLLTQSQMLKKSQKEILHNELSITSYWHTGKPSYRKFSRL